jgi:hypothetical protein
VVFADTEGIQAGLVGMFDFFHQVAEAIRRADDVAGGGVGKLRGETIDSNLHVEYLDVKVIDACHRRRIQEFWLDCIAAWRGVGYADRYARRV